MGSKGDRQDGLAGVGVNRVPPGFARPRDGASDPRVGRAAAGSLRTLLTIDVMNRSRPRWAARRSDAGAGYRAWGAPWERFRQVSRQLAVGRVIGVEERL